MTLAESPKPFESDSRTLSLGSIKVRRITLPKVDERVADISLLLGALSVVAFWAFGIGLILGIGAVITGVLGVRHTEADLLDSVIGIASGAVGIAAGAFFLSVALPYL